MEAVEEEEEGRKEEEEELETELCGHGVCGRSQVRSYRCTHVHAHTHTERLSLPAALLLLLLLSSTMQQCTAGIEIEKKEIVSLQLGFPR